MAESAQITFDVFTLDPSNELLWKGSDRIRLRPKTFALLRVLAEHPGQLLTKSELLNLIWQDCHVGDEALKHCVAEIRRLLSDDADRPRYVETVHRRGYRFVGKTGTRRTETASLPRVDEKKLPESYSASRLFIGRAPEIARLHQLLAKALTGVRQILFITGDEGIGKTSLVDAFLNIISPELSQPARQTGFDGLVARGQCIKSHGAGEAYMPIMEAFTGLCGTTKRKSIIALLRRHAPLWLSQMPSLVSATQWRTLQRSTRGATRERMMREMAEALESLTSAQPMILMLEDLHWSDYSTLDLIACLAQRRSPARLLVITTSRPPDPLKDDQPLTSIRQELQRHGQCEEMQLSSFSESAIREYLDDRFAGHHFPKEMAAWIQERTGGNPFFVSSVLDHLTARNFLVPHSGHWSLNTTLEEAAHIVPPTIRQIIERQIERCTLPEQHVLKAASVMGMEFSVAATAAVLGRRRQKVESVFQDLSRRNQFLKPAGENAGQNSCFRFSHSLHQNILYELLPEGLKRQYHRKIAEYIQQNSRTHPEAFAARLAMHFDRGRQPRRALKYYQIAADSANSRYAGREALGLAKRGLQLLRTLPEGPERREREVCLQNSLGTALMSVRGLGDEEVKKTFSRARDLFQTFGKQKQSGSRVFLFSSLYGLWCYHWAHAEYAAARELGEQLLQLAKAERKPPMLHQAHYSLGSILMDHGEFGGALQHLEKNPNVLSRCLAAVAKWSLGYPDQAIANIEAILARALKTGNPEHCIFANLCTARVHMARREIDQALERSGTALDLAIDHGLVEQWLAPMRGIRAWALAKLGQKQDGLEAMRKALGVFRAIGASNLYPLMLGMFAEISMDAGQLEEALAAIDEALRTSRKTGMNHHDSELCRLKGEILLRDIPDGSDPKDARFASAAACLEQAVRIARQQRAKSLELRATISLANMFQQREKAAEVRKDLQRLYDWFTEGFETTDLQQARTLLQHSQY